MTQYATMSSDSALLLSFQHKINEAVSLVRAMSTEQKLKAVQLWNFVSESLQDMVNSSANDIYALATQRCLRESCEQDEKAAEVEQRPREQQVFPRLVAHGDAALSTGCVVNDCVTSSDQHLLSDQSLLLFPSAASDGALAVSEPTSALSLTSAQPVLGQPPGDFPRVQHHHFHLQQQQHQLEVVASPAFCAPAEAVGASVVTGSGPVTGGEDELVELLSSTTADPAAVVEATALLDAALAQQPLQHQPQPQHEEKQDRGGNMAMASSDWRHGDDAGGDAVTDDDGGESLLIVGLCDEHCSLSSMHDTPVVSAQVATTALPPMPSLLDPISSRRVSQPHAAVSVADHRPQIIDSFTCHRHIDSGLTEYRCNTCAHTFASLRAFYTHYGGHTRRSVCVECGVSFSGNAQLSAHMSLSHPMAVSSGAVSAPVLAPSCQSVACSSFATSSTASVLTSPSVVSGGVGPVVSSCLPVSAGAVVDSVALPALHVCSVCRREFRSRSNLVRHMRSHTGEKRFACDICSRRFFEKKSMQVHLRVHTGERPFACTLCPARFRQQGNLDSHMEGHVGLRPHLCDLCGKRFRQRSQLRFHTQRHEDKKEFKCDQCDMAFNVLNDLVRHKRCHLETKPFRCDVCEKTFCRMEALNEHLNRHFDRRPFTCPHCPRSFPEMSACRRHIRKHEIDGTVSAATTPSASAKVASYTAPSAIDCAQITA